MLARLSVSFILALVLVAAPGCVTNDKSSPTDYDPTHGTAVKWHRGTLEQAFALAKQKNQAVLLYWGAVWCPPCNELKAEVFSKPHFKDLMSTAVPVYLDGDSEYAQAWGELFQIAGYPTILVLDHEKQELMRISESLSMDEFSTAFRSAVQGSRPFLLTLERALAGEATEQDWRLLAYFAWYGARGVDVHDPAMLAKRQQLAEQVPENLVAERALLSARLLESAAASATPESATKTKIKQDAGRYLNAMMVDKEARFAARATLISGHNNILGWAYDADASTRQLMSDKWAVAANRLRSDPRLSNDQRLWTWYPEIQAARARVGASGKLPAALVASVRAAVDAADAAAKTLFERQSVIAGAAHLLAKVGEHDAAAKMLLTEAERSESPYYYYAALASLERDRNHKTQALTYSRKASSTAEGRATKLQWIVSDISLTAQLAEADKQERIHALSEEFYNLLFHIKDGFSGRSYRSVKRVGDILAGVDLNATFRKELKGYSARCGRLGDIAKARCQDHFATVLAANPQVRGE